MTVEIRRKVARSEDVQHGRTIVGMEAVQLSLPRTTDRTGKLEKGIAVMAEAGNRGPSTSAVQLSAWCRLAAHGRTVDGLPCRRRQQALAGRRRFFTGGEVDMRVMSRIDLRSIVWAREVYTLEGTQFNEHFFQCRHSFDSLVIVAVEVDDDNTIHRAWCLDSVIPGVTPPLDITSDVLHRPEKIHTVFAASIRPGTRTELYNPAKNTARYVRLDKPPLRWLHEFAKHDRVFVIYVSRWRRFAGGLAEASGMWVDG